MTSKESVTYQKITFDKSIFFNCVFTIMRAGGIKYAFYTSHWTYVFSIKMNEFYKKVILTGFMRGFRFKVVKWIETIIYKNNEKEEEF